MKGTGFLTIVSCGLLAAFLTLLGNLPFAAVQRYNRFRLQTVRKRRLRTQKGEGMETAAACV